MTDTQIVRQVYPNLSKKDKEIFRTIISLSALLLMSIQEQQSGPTNSEEQNQTE